MLPLPEFGILTSFSNSQEEASGAPRARGPGPQLPQSGSHHVKPGPPSPGTGGPGAGSSQSERGEMLDTGPLRERNECSSDLDVLSAAPDDSAWRPEGRGGKGQLGKARDGGRAKGRALTARQLKVRAAPTD